MHWDYRQEFYFFKVLRVTAEQVHHLLGFQFLSWPLEAGSVNPWDPTNPCNKFCVYTTCSTPSLFWSLVSQSFGPHSMGIVKVPFYRNGVSQSDLHWSYPDGSKWMRCWVCHLYRLHFSCGENRDLCLYWEDGARPGQKNENKIKSKMYSTAGLARSRKNSEESDDFKLNSTVRERGERAQLVTLASS